MILELSFKLNYMDVHPVAIEYKLWTRNWIMIDGKINLWLSRELCSVSLDVVEVLGLDATSYFFLV